LGGTLKEPIGRFRRSLWGKRHRYAVGAVDVHIAALCFDMACFIVWFGRHDAYSRSLSPE
jgi:hypothetical protein